VASESLIEKCCLLANPAGGNPTQYLVEQAFERAGLDWRFMTFEIETERLGDAMRGIRALGFHGVKIGEPFHASVIEHVDELTDAARRVGSINCISATGGKLVGDNTEGTAVVELVRKEFDPTGKKVLIIGAGRLARVIALELAGAGASGITVTSRDPTSGQQLVEAIQRQSSAAPTFLPLTGKVAVDADVDLMVNATSLGSATPDAKLPLDTESFTPKLVVVDATYNTSRTWVTAQAAQKGCRIIDGLSIYVEQTALALQRWTGKKPDVAAMREAAEEFLGI
jgi:shikimate dehydrogenase